MSAPLLLALSLTATGADLPPLPLGDDYLRADQLPVSPPDAGWSDTPWNVVDLEDLTVVRVPEHVLGDGFVYADFTAAIQAATAGRSADYDLVVVTHSGALIPEFGNAAAFHLAYNNADVWGTGDDPVVTPDVSIRSGLWMNHVDYWDTWPADLADWVFCHEVGHQWLTYAALELPESSPDGTSTDRLALLGRQRAHWSYFVDTANSPMEGNAWVDNGDGTWTTDTESGMVFTPTDLYMMGLRSADAVPDFFVLEPTEATDLYREHSPQHRYPDDPPVTLAAEPRAVTTADLVEANGPWRAGDYTAAHVQALHVVLATPHESLSPRVLDRAREKRDEWLAAWAVCTTDEGVFELGVVDEGWTAGPLPTAPALVPGGAW